MKRVKLLLICSFLLFLLIMIFQISQQDQPIFVDLKYSLTTFPTCNPSQEFFLFIKANCKDRWSTKAEQKN